MTRFLLAMIFICGTAGAEPVKFDNPSVFGGGVLTAVNQSIILFVDKKFSSVQITAQNGAGSAIAYSYKVSDDGLTWQTATAYGKFTGSGTTSGSLVSGSSSVIVNTQGTSYVAVSCTSNTSNTQQPILMQGGNGVAGITVNVGTFAGSGITSISSGSSDAQQSAGFIGGSMMFGYVGGNFWSFLRTSNIFKPVLALDVTVVTGGSAWTPASGKKFRLLGLQLTGTVAGTYTLYDGTVTITAQSLQANVTGPFVPMDNGYLSAAANNVLKMTGPALATATGLLKGDEE